MEGAGSSGAWGVDRNSKVFSFDGQGEQRSRRKPNLQPSKASKSTTFFFSNFPNGFGEKDMLKIFQRWARVQDVFISRRLNKWGKRFGFVRLFDVKNVGKLERELDKIYIGSTKLFVNIPKYHRVDVSREEGRNKSSVGTGRLEHGVMERVETEVNKSYKGKEVWVEKGEKKSFADAVRRQERWAWKGPVFTAKQQSLPWMEGSVVGRFNTDLDFEQLGEEFVRGGMSMLRVRAMGDNLALLTSRGGKKMEEIINLNKEWFNSVLVKMQPWSPSFTVSHRVVWVRCLGLPITLWNRESFARVVGDIVTLIDIDDATLMWENLEFARLKVRIENNRLLRVARKFRINDQNISVFIEEEHPVVLAGQCKDSHRIYDSSDSITSTETYVEESAFSVKSYEEGGVGRTIERSQMKGKVVGGGEEDEGQAQRLNARLGELSAGFSSCQEKGGNPFTDEESQRQKLVEEPDFGNAAIQVGKRSFCSFSAHAELARLVVDVESMYNQDIFVLGLGQGRKEAQEDVLQTGMGVGYSGSRPGNALSDLGSEMETRFRTGGRQGGARGEGTYAFQEQENNMNVEKEGSRNIYLELESAKKKTPMEHDGTHAGNISSKNQDAVLGIGTHRRRGGMLLGCREGGGHEERGVTTTQRRRKIKGLVDLEGSKSHPRRSVRIRIKCPQNALSFLSRQGMPTVSLSDGDIDNCNLRLREFDSPEEPIKLWEISRKVGIRCHKDEQEVIQEFSSLEERDLKTMSCVEEGKKRGFL